MNSERELEEREKDAAALQFIEEVTKKCGEVQQRVLAEILTQNAGTEYLNRFGLNRATDIGTFTSKVPVVKYEDIRPDIQRIANGDFSPVICAQPISEFQISSGTSAGEGKLIPTTVEEMKRRMQFSSLLMPVMRRIMPGIDKGKALNFMFIKAEKKTPGGLMAQPFLTSFYKSDEFKNQPSNAFKGDTSPYEAILCRDSFQSMYTQMLCGLYESQTVFRLGAPFASGLIRAIQFLQVHYPDLCHDISNGTLSSKITDPDIQACMGKTMRPDPELANFIKKECEDEKWEGIIRRIWANTKYLETIVTGAMAQYIPTLDYYSGGLPKVSSLYATSECFFGLNLNPLCNPSDVSYTMMPHMGYFEFIQLDVSPECPTRESMPRLVNSTDLEVGKEYELVVTTYAGLYRYQVGDVLLVTGFYNSAPNIKFVRRKNVLLSIDVDKTDELELQKAVENASALLRPFNTSIIDYTSYADTKTIPGHYVIYWEMLTKDSTNRPSHEVLDRCCLEMEEALSDIYREGRVAVRSIGPLEIRVVKNGTFEKLMDYAISRGASMSQYKVPRCVNFMPIVELLDSNVVSAHFSQSLPHWSPERCE